MAGDLIRQGKAAHKCSGMPHPKDAGWMAVWRCGECKCYWISYEDAWFVAGPFFHLGRGIKWVWRMATRGTSRG